MLDLLFVLCDLGESLLFALHDDVFNLFLEVPVLSIEAINSLLQVFDLTVPLNLLLFSDEGLAHSISDRALVKRLVGLNGHLDFVARAHQKETAFSTVDRDLTDQLVEALRVKLLAHGADTGVARALLLDLVVKLVLKVHHVHFGCGLRRNVTYIKRAALRVFPWRKDRIQIVLVPVAGLGLHGVQLLLLLLVLLASEGCAHQRLGSINNEGHGFFLRHIYFKFIN